MSRKEERKELLKEDPVVASLEKGQYWLESNYRWIAAIVLIAVVGAFFSHYRTVSRANFEAKLWEKSSKLSTMDERRAFLAEHPRAEASVMLYLVLARQELDGKLYDKAVEHAKKHVELFPGHPLSDVAYLLQGYGSEELGRKDEAVSAYKKASEKSGGAARELAEMALARLGAE